MDAVPSKKKKRRWMKAWSWARILWTADWAFRNAMVLCWSVSMWLARPQAQRASYLSKASMDYEAFKPTAVEDGHGTGGRACVEGEVGEDLFRW